MTNEAALSETERCVQAAEASLAAGNPLPAYDLTRQALERWPGHARLRQLHALALLRSGSAAAARPVLESLAAEGVRDEETLGMLARLSKDAALDSAHTDERRRLLHLAADLYGESWRLHRSTWAGVNAAMCLTLAGDRARAAAIATGVRKALGTTRGSGDAYWVEATLGEAGFILGDEAGARDHYSAAADLARAARRYGDLASTRRNAALLSRALAREPAFDPGSILAAPGVVLFTGHRPDADARSSPRFPRELEAYVAAEIARALDRAPAAFGFSSAAAGADLLFLEAFLDRGGEAHVVLPCAEGEFIDASIAPSGGDWVSRWHALRSRVTTISVAADELLPESAASFVYANRLLLGLARIRARFLGAQVRGLAVWDPSDPATPGGTTETVRWWQTCGMAVDVVTMGAPGGTQLDLAAGTPSAVIPNASETELAAFVFGDAVGFSRLRDRQMPAFVDGFLGAVADVVRRQGSSPLLANTWGDGVFFVFREPAGAAEYALDLVDALHALDRNALNLPPDLTLRVGLHAGPVYHRRDPVTGRTNYFGAHVSRAARIEPITPPGQVYASESFAALLAASADQAFRYDYVGRIPLAKHYGDFPMYHLARGRDIGVTA